MNAKKKDLRSRAPTLRAARDNNVKIHLGGKKINMVFSDHGQLLAFDLQGFVVDPQTGRKWMWLERDQPGLNDFLQKFVQNWYPFVYTGRKFTAGRKPGTGGPIRKAIARLLKKKPAMKNTELWKELSARPPKGWQFYDNRAGKYIEGPKAGDGMNYDRFRTVTSEERGKFKE